MVVDPAPRQATQVWENILLKFAVLLVQREVLVMIDEKRENRSY